MSLPSYSVAIRTLGTAGEKYKRELESIAAQTLQPERVVVYLAEGYERPAFTVGKEEYVEVKKGMVAQRALPYDEIQSDCILLLDDDVLLAPDSAALLLESLRDSGADCVAADTFQNHAMSFRTKLFAAAANLVFPHSGSRWAFKMHRNGSFSYNRHPENRLYESQCCGGPAMMWKKTSLLGMHFEDELWMDSLGFAYGDDALESYKLHANGGRLCVLYGSGVSNLDARSSSGSFRKGANHVYTRTKASYMIWYRSLYRNGADTSRSRTAAATAFGIKSAWLFLVMCGAALLRFDASFISQYVRGLRDGRKEVRSEAFRRLPAYIVK